MQKRVIVIIGTIKEIKNNENRVGLTPANVKTLVEAGHKVLVQKTAGNGAGFSDKDYERAGAELFGEPIEIAKRTDLLVKIKEPLPEEYSLLEAMKNKTLFTFLHLAAADKSLTLELMKNNITAIAYETVEDKQGKLPLLSPMSEIAGILAVQYGAQFLQKKYAGRGITLGRIQNTETANVAIIGAGAAGAKTATIAAGLGCNVIVIEKSLGRIKQLKKDFKKQFGKISKNISILDSSKNTVSKAVQKADLLVGAVLVKGAKAPLIVNEEQVKAMKKGAVIVDIAIDQGGCIFGSKPTTHENPIYELGGKIYCCITNMPGQVPLQATQALTAATMPRILKMAKLGVEKALKQDAGLAKGLNTYNGKIVYKPVAEALGLEYTKPVL